MAHASVASLMRTIESLLTSNSPMESLICNHREEFRILHGKVSSLELFLRNFEKNNVTGEMTDLEVQVKEVANAAEYTIQLRLTETGKGENKSQKGKACRRFRQSLRQVAKDIDHVWKESTKIQDKGKQAAKESLVQDYSSSAKDMVGRDDQRERLLKDLTRGNSDELKVIPIVGMGGIGKTTLAKEVYNDAFICSRFDVRAWATISQQYNVKNILLSLLHSTIKMDDMVNMKGEEELADMLQKSLKGKRYLIVMDDIWSIEVWDYVRLCFPIQNNGSSILLTTRNNEVACYADTENLSLQMGFMNQDESWNLFKSAAFADDALPSEFETIGKQIAEECHGLPLTIVVVAGLLKSIRAIEDWENVAKDVKSFVTNDPDERCSHVLGLSYNHLTSYLKTCLLYFGIFPEDIEIPVKHLMRLWMAEGFLNSEKDLEGEAEKCLQDLINRCLVLVSKKSLDETKIRSCKVHDLIYDLCLREVQRGNIVMVNDIVFEKSDAIKSDAIKSDAVKCSDLKACLLYFRNVFDCESNHVPSKSRSLGRMQPLNRWTGDEISDFPHGLYRALLTPGHHQLTDDDKSNLFKRTHSILFWGRNHSTFILKSKLIRFKLLKVLDLSHIKIDRFPRQILTLIWLRYLSLLSSWHFDIPPEICRLWNLQTFIVKSYRPSDITFPEQIWRLMLLRHVEVKSGFYLPNCPSRFVDRETQMGFSNIQTISYLSLRCCTKEVILGIQNVKKLGIRGDGFAESRLLENLHQLETLSLRFYSRSWFDMSGAKYFPATLKKLKLEGTDLSWSYLDIIAMLPNLEVLKLMSNACRGREWNLTVRGFTRLKLLLIQYNNLESWKATNDNFPVLERLVIRDCPHLNEIPIEFADILSLQLIELKWCNPELEESVARIKQAQEDLGNEPVNVRIIKT